MRVKTSELIDAALDWATGVAGGTPGLHVVNKPGKVCVYGTLQMPSGELLDWPVQPSTNWSQGGPIINNIKGFIFKQWLESKPESCCEAHIHNYDGDWIEFGPTPLIAAMRCFVSSKLGDEVDVPEELL